MMVANALNTFDVSKLRLTKRDWQRAIVAGLAFGLLLTIGLTAMTAWQCVGICPPEIVVNAGLSLAVGIFGIGPIAAYGGQR